jgi:hypothetical protein
MPKVSIIIPAFNSADTIVEALESVKAQTYTDYEVIVVDDASIDNTVEVVEAWLGTSETTGTWRLLRQAQNTGPAAARNRGIQESCGEWLAFLDSDDIWLSGKLELQMQLVVRQPAVALWCGEYIDFVDKAELSGCQDATLLNKDHLCQPGTTQQIDNLKTEDLRAVKLEDFARGNPIGCATVLVRRETLAAAGGFDEQFRGPEDYDLWMRVAALPTLCVGQLTSRSVVFCAIPVTLHRIRQGSLSMEDRTFLPQVMRVLDKAFSAGGALEKLQHVRREAVSSQYWNASWMAYSRGARWTALLLVWKAWRLHWQAGCAMRRPWVKRMCRYVLGGEASVQRRTV